MNLRDAAQQALEACTDVVNGWESLAPLSVRRAAVESLDALKAALAEPEHEIIQRMRRLRAEAQAEQQQAIEQGKCPSCMQPLPEELRTEYAMQKLTDIHQEMEAGCARCRSPLWAGTKCSACGKDWASLGVPDEAKAEIYRAQAEEEIKKNRYIKVSERTVRNTIARVKVFAREIPINPTLLKAADEMERMLTELIELRRKK